MEKSRVKYKVLILDDEAQIRRLLRMTLEANDYKVYEAGSSKEGIQAVTMNHPDVILLDLGLPDENRPEFSSPSPRVVSCTGNHSHCSEPGIDHGVSPGFRS